MPEQITASTVLILSLCAVFLALSVYIRARKKELPLPVRLVFSAFAIGLASKYAYDQGRVEDWWLPGLLAVALTLGIVKTSLKPPPPDEPQE